MCEGGGIKVAATAEETSFQLNFLEEKATPPPPLGRTSSSQIDSTYARSKRLACESVPIPHASHRDLIIFNQSVTSNSFLPVT